MVLRTVRRFLVGPPGFLAAAQGQAADLEEQVCATKVKGVHLRDHDFTLRFCGHMRQILTILRPGNAA